MPRLDRLPQISRNTLLALPVRVNDTTPFARPGKPLSACRLALVTTAGLRPTAEGKRVRLRRGVLTSADGPFTETKEVIGGFAILEADSLEEAVRLTERFLLVHGDEWDIECEVRRMEGPGPDET